MPNETLSDKDLIARTADNLRLERWPQWSPDVLLCHPSDARQLCRLVRQRLRRPLTEFEILWTFLNGRKRGLLGSSPRRRARKSTSGKG